MKMKRGHTIERKRLEDGMQHLFVDGVDVGTLKDSEHGAMLLGTLGKMFNAQYNNGEGTAYITVGASMALCGIIVIVNGVKMVKKNLAVRSY